MKNAIIIHGTDATVVLVARSEQGLQETKKLIQNIGQKGKISKRNI